MQENSGNLSLSCHKVHERFSLLAKVMSFQIIFVKEFISTASLPALFLKDLSLSVKIGL